MIGEYADDPNGYKEMLGYVLVRARNRAKGKIPTTTNTKTCMCDIDSLIASEIDCKSCRFAHTFECVLSEGMYRLVK